MRFFDTISLVTAYKEAEVAWSDIASKQIIFLCKLILSTKSLKTLKVVHQSSKYDSVIAFKHDRL